MSKSNTGLKSLTKSSSSQSGAAPTARSPSLTTASALTDHRQMPTALSNSANTAIGTCNSDFDNGSGFTDTSAGSSRATSPCPMTTAKSSTSQEMMLHDLRRGSLFGRQSQGGTTAGPNSVTNVTLSNNTNLSTASDLSLKEIKTDVSGPSRRKKTSKKHGKRRTSSISDPSGKSAKSGKSVKFASKKSGKSKKSASKNIGFGGEKSTKSTKSIKNGAEKQDFGGEKSIKSTKSVRTASRNIDLGGEKSVKSSQAKKEIGLEQRDFGDEKSTKSTKSKKIGAEKREIADLSKKSTKKVEKKHEKKAEKRADESVYFPGVQMSTGQPKQLNKPSSYQFPGSGKTARPDTFAAPVPVPNNPEANVYDVADLSTARRGLQDTVTTGPAPRKSLFGKGQNQRTCKRPPGPSALSAALSAPRAPRAPPKDFGNKIVIVGATPDGKTHVQMTIDMQVVAGEALGASNEPVTLVPKKVIAGGREMPIDSKKNAPKNE